MKNLWRSTRFHEILAECTLANRATNIAKVYFAPNFNMAIK